MHDELYFEAVAAEYPLDSYLFLEAMSRNMNKIGQLTL
jgi:hypothetical protein